MVSQLCYFTEIYVRMCKFRTFIALAPACSTFCRRIHIFNFCIIRQVQSTHHATQLRLPHTILPMDGNNINSCACVHLGNGHNCVDKLMIASGSKAMICGWRRGADSVCCISSVKLNRNEALIESGFIGWGRSVKFKADINSQWCLWWSD